MQEEDKSKWRVWWHQRIDKIFSTWGNSCGESSHSTVFLVIYQFLAGTIESGKKIRDLKDPVASLGWMDTNWSWICHRKPTQNPGLATQDPGEKEPQEIKLTLNLNFSLNPFTISKLYETQRNQVERSCQDSKNLSMECWSLMVFARQKLRFRACNKWGPGKHSGLQLRSHKSYTHN